MLFEISLLLLFDFIHKYRINTMMIMPFHQMKAKSTFQDATVYHKYPALTCSIQSFCKFTEGSLILFNDLNK